MARRKRRQREEQTTITPEMLSDALLLTLQQSSIQCQVVAVGPFIGLTLGTSESVDGSMLLTMLEMLMTEMAKPLLNGALVVKPHDHAPQPSRRGSTDGIPPSAN